MGKTRISDEYNSPEFMAPVIDAGFVLSKPVRMERERLTEYDVQGPGVFDDGDYLLLTHQNGQVTAHRDCTNIFINPADLPPGKWETAKKGMANDNRTNPRRTGTRRRD
jgi:hypothetical protein